MVAKITSKRTSPRGLPAFAGAASLSGVVVVLCGCAVGPTFTPPQATVAANWRATNDPKIATQTAADSLWWKAFNDPALDRLVELAYHQNLPLQIAGLQDRGGARPAGRRRRAGSIPQIAGRSSAARPRSGSAEDAGQPSPTSIAISCDFQVGFDAAWELDFWGKYRRGVEAEAAGLLASVADYDYALVSLTAEVARTYVVIRTFEVLIDAGRSENAKLQEEALRHRRVALPQRRDLGARRRPRRRRCWRAPGPPSPSCRSACEQARNALSTLLGQPTGAVDALLAGPKEIPKAPAAGGGRACRPRCCGGVPTSAAPSCSPPRSVPASASPRPTSIRASRCSARSASSASDRGEAPPQPRSPPSSIFYSVGPQHQLAVLQLRPDQEQRARRGRAVSAAARRLPRHRAQGGAGGGGRAGRLPQRPGSRRCSSRAPSTAAQRSRGARHRAVPRRRRGLSARARRAALAAAGAEQPGRRRARRSRPT